MPEGPDAAAGRGAEASGSFRISPYVVSGRALGAVFDALETVGCAKVVGGAVRNSLLGEPIADIDLATDAEPPDVARAAEAAGLTVHPTGLAHGTLTLVSDGSPFEVTTLREDVSTDGRRATVRFTKDWAADAARRDFTMNALYVDRAGNGLDTVGGHADCLARRVRFIGEADQRIVEDVLRILRFFRFHAAYGRGDMDAEGLAAARRHRASIATLPVERIAQEFMRTLAAPRAAEVLPVLGEEGFVAPHVPGPFDLRAYAGLVEAERLAGRGGPTPGLALAAILGFDPQAFAAAADALRLPRKVKARGLAAIAAADAMPPRSAPQVNALLYEHGAEGFGDGVLVAAARGVDIVDLPHLLRQAREWRRPRLPVSGPDLLGNGGKPGPELGKRLRALESVWRASDFALGREDLIAIDRRTTRD